MSPEVDPGVGRTPSGSSALPAFLGIGALKAGTTYLDSLLRGHPGLSFPVHLKETDYFSAHAGRGPQWYADLFAPDDGRLRGEVSPTYVSHPLAPARVQAANPDVRLLVSLRDPVDRVVSQYRHWVQETAYRGDLPRFVREHPNAVDRSRYSRDLEPWVERFGASAIHVVTFEDLLGDPVGTAQAAADFVGVQLPDGAGAWVPDVGGETNASLAPRFPRAYAAAKSLSRRLADSGRADLVDRVKRSGPARALRRGRPGAPAGAPVADEVLAELADLLAGEAQRTSALLAREVGRQWLRDA